MNKKLFLKYAVIWLILFTAFNVIVFLIPVTIAGYSRLTRAFWTGYAFIIIAFLGELVCGWFALKADSLSRLFYNIPLLTISYIGMLMMLVIGSLFMTVPYIPIWLGIILCFLILAFTAIAVIKASTVSEIVQNTDTRVRLQTSTMRELTMQAENLIDQAKSEMVREECQKIYEALRYSDPITNPSLTSWETSISVKMKELTTRVQADDKEKCQTIVVEILNLLQERNRKCKLLK